MIYIYINHEQNKMDGRLKFTLIYDSFLIFPLTRIEVELHRIFERFLSILIKRSYSLIGEVVICLVRNRPQDLREFSFTLNEK